MLALNKNINMPANCNVSEALCLVCNLNLDISSSFNIFDTFLSGNGEMLANFIFGVLNPVTNLTSSYICLQCYNLFVMLEQAQSTVKNIQNEIIKIYQSSKHGKKMPIKNEIVLSSDDEENEKITSRLDFTKKLTIPSHFNDLNQIETFGELNNADPKKTESLNNSKKISSSSTTNIHIPENLYVLQIDQDTTIGTEGTTMIDNEIHNITNQTISSPNENNIHSKDILTMIDENVASKETTLEKIPRVLNIEVHQNKLDAFNNTLSTECLKESAYEKKNCEKSFKKPGKKLKINHEKSLKYTCMTCDKKWKTLSDLKAHIKTHSNVRPFMCEKCGQAYKHKHALEIHVGMHNGINPFQCCFCSKSFTQKGALIRHLPLHTGEKPYQCDLCGKRFAHHSSYNMHILSHTGKKPHQCSICDLSLLSSSHLKRHMRVHTGEKPYTCTSCGKKFAERYNLLSHQKIHTSANGIKADKNIQYKCKYCNQLFIKQVLLDEHIEQQHKVQTQAESNSNWLPEQLQSGNVKSNFTKNDAEWQCYSYDKMPSVQEDIKTGSSNIYKEFNTII
ncbi:zinc finger protein 83-like [Chelonus insularis]|uniref:zinc finger protein 83-like n=1 Tax=Chelonus insularis TaxID=460826 RepID=UPI00158EBC5D|nr:zinc finger protein 83-like [Chelonus insularis]